MVNVDGIKTLDEEETSPFTLVAIADMAGDEAPEECSPNRGEILMVALTRTIPQHVKEVPVYRVSGVKPGSGQPKAEEITELERK